MKRSNNGGAAGRRRKLSAKTIDQLVDAKAHLERSLALIDQVLDSDNAEAATALSWRLAEPMH